MQSEDICWALNSFVGSMDGLNLRNMVWHGYLNKYQFDPAFTSFLIMVCVSIPPPAEKLHKQMMDRASLRFLSDFFGGSQFFRPPKNFHDYVKFLDFGKGTRVLGEINEKERKEIENVFESSFFILAGFFLFK